uniref:Uncharacterized protein LOC104229815 n=1 Tax=Nicotiana sylvestris TaxID=4096 RepID=A0A1U7WQG8_NICSY|nr:PREDICTED: uncharacterized protein LOC104229815 [Nicotiana sylvestris]
MKLNPEKYAFEVGSGKFLGFMVSNRGIEINPDKIKATEEITVVNNMKSIQRLTERIAALGRFISRSSDWSHHFFSLLKKKNNFVWTPECQQALEELKRYLSSPSLLYTLKEDETLYLYLAVSEVAISGMLVREEKGLELAKGLGAEVIDAKCDSLLVVNQRNKYIDYLKHGKLPSDPKESRALRAKAARFSLDENGTLYRRTFDGPLAVCLGPGDTDYVLREIHEGTCGNHFGADSLVRKVIRTGYYWDSMEKDTKEFVRRCDKCQRLALMIHQPDEQLHSVLSPWPFMK